MIYPEYLSPYFDAAEAAAKENLFLTDTFINILNSIRKDEKLSTAATWEDRNKVREGILARVPEEMTKYASQWRVTPETLEEKTAEMINAAGEFPHPKPATAHHFLFEETNEDTPPSLLHRSRPTSPQASQTRLLLSALRDLCTTPLPLPATPLALHRHEVQAARVESPPGSLHVRIPALCLPARR